MSDFVHLHLHSQYSLLDGANRLDDVVAAAAAAGMPALALTDHGNLFGAIAFYEAARRAQVKPIVGIEAYVAQGSHTDRDPPRIPLRQTTRNRQPPKRHPALRRLRM